MQLISKLNQVLVNMENLTAELKSTPELAERLGLVHAWYIDARNPHEPVFGFSKFIGYDGLNARAYLREYKNLNGRNTEWALKEFCEELSPGTPQFNAYHDQLTAWLAQFGKTPRNPVRLMILNAENEGAVSDEDTRLLDLLVAVADLLPVHQRHSLRSRL